MPRPLANFHPAVASWFENHLGAPTRIQERSWPVLSSGGHALISAPTGSGKTLAAFLSILNDLFVRALAGDLEPASKILYVSPLKALSNDVEKNLEAPLSGIADELRRNGITAPDVRVMVRTGDSTAAHRARMLRQKPHIIVTTPESLYVLLTSESGRNLLSTIETIIVDEVHAVVANRRGAHLALSMERLERVTGRRLQRIGISATVRPLQTVADFLAPGQDVTILHEGHHRETEIRMILPSTPLDAVMTMDAWADVNKQIAAMVQGIRTCLIFVNNRRLCERLSRQLSELLGDEYVGAHHGSLSYPQRLRAETALKDGRLKVMVATSSLELGIDVGSIDLVIQIASPRSIHAFLQRIGRSEHRHDGVSRAVLIPLTRDDLLECASVLYAMKSGGLEEISIPEAPLDVLAQQIVAEVSCGDVTSDELFTSITQSYPYRHLKRERFEEILGMLADGFTLRFGRRSRYVFYDRSRGTLQARKGARLSAITNGGAIPDNFEYEVILENEGAFLGTVHEDFAIESIAGDVFQLGNQFWRILRISTGKVMVAPAPGATPTMPFWIAEAPGRTVELSRAVSDLREELSHRLSLGLEGFTEFLETQAGLPAAAAAQVFEYLRETEKTLGTIPTQKRVVMERFFDEAGDCHIVIHSPYGARINRAWGLALRKRFCRKFNFELQAAASDDAVLFSLSKTHSFALSDVFSYVKRAAGEGLLKQAVLASPMFEIRWRWNASRSLAILRTYGGRRTPPQIQKSQAQDLVALVFPDQIACAENISGDRQIPNHPLVDQTMDDCMTEAMDLPGWLTLLGGIETGAVETRSVDTAAPSLIAHEILNARPYAFLDDAPLEERRSRAVRTDMRPVDDDALLPDASVVDQVRADSRPAPRDISELYDLLTTFGILPEEELTELNHPDWTGRLYDEERLQTFTRDGRRFIVPADRFGHAGLLFGTRAETPPGLTYERALDDVLRGHLELRGPMDVGTLSRFTSLEESVIDQAFLRYENEGWLFRTKSNGNVLWCERSFWQRMQHYRRRYGGHPVTFTPEQYLSFLVRWQHAHPDTRLEGPGGVEKALSLLEGCSMSVDSWHKVLERRVDGFQQSFLDHLILTGAYVWWRPARESDAGRRSITRHTPVMILSRELLKVLEVPEAPALSHYAQSVYGFLKENGASFLSEIQGRDMILPDHIRFGLKELIARGLVTSDSLTALTSLFTARRRSFGGSSRTYLTAQVGRWSLMKRAGMSGGRSLSEDEGDLIVAQLLLRRYGLISRYFAEREFLNRPWSRLVRTLRRLEMRGEVRGGRFVKNIWGEQFALPNALTWMESLFAAGAPPEEALPSFEPADPVSLTSVIRDL